MDQTPDTLARPALGGPRHGAIWHGEDRAEFYKALAAARKEFPEIPKNRVASVRSQKGSFSYKYADLSDVFNAVDSFLSAHGLSVSQWVLSDTLWTEVAHESGTSRATPYPIHTDKAERMHPGQEHSKAVTLAKRYGLTAALGVATEESIEGDHSRRRPATQESMQMDDNFGTGDGTRMPKGAKFTKDSTPREKAEAASEAIIEQFSEAKTQKGVNGAWNRNTMFIDLLGNKHEDLYQNVFDAFHSRLESVEDD
jgi:hypothetical protein